MRDSDSDGAGLAGTVWAIVLLFVLATVAVAAAQLLRGHREALAASEAQLTRFVDGAEAALNRSFIETDVLLGEIGPSLDLAHGPDGEIELRAARQVLAGVVRRKLALHNLAVYDMHGRMLVAARDDTDRLGVPLPAGFAAATGEAAAERLRVFGPELSRSSSEQALFLVRGTVLPGGARLLAVAEVPLPVLTALLAPAVQVPGMVATLERSPAGLVASVPAFDRRLSHSLAPLPPAAADGGVMREAGRLGGQPGLLVVRPLLHDSLHLTAGMSTEAVLADWRADRRLALGVAAAFVALIVAAGAAVHTQLNRLRRARHEVAQAKGVLEGALASISDGFLLCDAADRVQAWNERYLEIFPWLQPVIAQGVPYERLIEAARPHVRFAGPAAAPGEPWTHRRLALHRSGDGAHDQLLADGRVIHAIERRTPDGGVVGVFRDVTVAERALARAKTDAEAASRAKSRFLAAMSHEIRTPLNGVLGMNVLLQRTPLTEEQRGYVETIRRSGKTLLALIDDILDLSRIEAGRVELVSADLDVRRVVGDVVASLRAAAAQKSLALEVQIADELPAPLRGDESRLRQVLLNLAANAVKFTERGSVRIEARHRPLDDGRVELVLAVHDTGIGIEGDVLPQLFERFTQADGGIARRYGGSGLGLAISRELVALMGGAIDVASVPGQGSTFRVTLALPRGAAAAAAERDDTGFGALQRPAAALRVLVAEDNEVNQILVRELLALLGHEAVVVGDGEAAVQAALGGGFDLVLMDIQMPRMDGLAAARAMRERGLRLPIVALTANAMLEERAACLDAGMDDHVSKPIEPRALAAAIDRVGSLATAGR